MNLLHKGLGVLLCVALPVAAQTAYYTRISVEARHGMDQTVSDGTDSDYLELEGFHGRLRLDADSDGMDPVFNGYAAAWTDLRAAGMHLHAVSQAVSPVFQQRTFAIADATGYFSDRFALNVPGAATGALFTVKAQVRLFGTLATDPHGDIYTPTPANVRGATTFWQASAKVTGADGPTQVSAREDCATFTQISGGGCTVSGTPGLVTLTFTMQNNGLAGLELFGSLRTNASSWATVAAPSVSEAEADMSHTVAWGGVVELRDASGALMDGAWSLQSATSGFDYRQAYAAPVPEPGTLGLWLAGLAAMAGLTRRRIRGTGSV